MAPDFWTAYWAFVSFVFGAIVGSFLNVCIWRLPRGESLREPPSHCPSCNTRLRFFPDMVPLLSQLWSRARCRYCSQPYSWRYFWVELITAVVFTGIYLRYVPFGTGYLPEETRNWSALLGMGFAAALVTIFFIDLDTFEIPDVTVLVAVVFAVAKDLVLIQAGARPLVQQIPGTPWSVPAPLSIVSGLIAFWLLWQFATLSTAALGREAMGAGDSLLLAAMGAFLIPWPLVIVAFMIAVVLGTVGGLTGIWLARDPAPIDAETLPVDSEVEEPPSEQAEGGISSGEAVAGSRGAAALPEADGDPDVPALPASSRWGRLLTVVGTWLAVGSLWMGAVTAAGSGVTRGLLIGLGIAAASAALLYFGIRMWVSQEKDWLKQMDELFEGDPGPRFIPFGPYLVAGTLGAMFFGRPLVEWYVQSMGFGPLKLPWD
jgi:leader peptidase (prepilin peptidase) / N-methyltransferase